MRHFLILRAALFATSASADLQIIDGDTLELDGVTYRLDGIGAPEHGQKRWDWSCGKDATDALARFTTGKDITCDRITDDTYGRIIATCMPMVLI